MTWLGAALALIKLLNVVFSYLDDEKKKQAAEALVNAENLQADLKAIADANEARAAEVARLAGNPDLVRVPDQAARKPRPRSK